MVDAWVEILREVPNAILWLYNVGQKEVECNLKEYFESKGISSSRIVFCGKVYYKDHYRRMALMDLFLDTPVYNGHTTVLEALWMNIPVLTIQGKTVNDRLGYSFVKTAGITELVAKDINEYVQKAIEIGKSGTAGTLSEKLKKSKPTSPLFNTREATLNLEKAYLKMWEIFLRGEKPCDFKIE